MGEDDGAVRGQGRLWYGRTSDPLVVGGGAVCDGRTVATRRLVMVRKSKYM
jgi:hypothetical protein